MNIYSGSRVNRPASANTGLAGPTRSPAGFFTGCPTLSRSSSSTDGSTVLAFNDAAAELFGPAFKGRTYGRNVAFQAFTSPELSALLGNEGAAHLARVAAAELRKAMSIYPEDDRLRSLFRELSKNSSEFDRHWERGEIGTWRSAMKQVNHPTNGTLAFDSEMLHDPENDHWVMFFTPRRS